MFDVAVKEGSLKPTRARTEAQKRGRREQILQAAETLYLESKGYEAVSVAEVARAAGVAKGTVYLYFDTKEALFLALYDRVSSAWCANARQALEAAPGIEPVAEVVDAFATACDRVPLHARLNAILHVSLEPNVPPDALLASKRGLLSDVDGMTPALCRLLGLADTLVARELVREVYVVLIGAHHNAGQSPALAAVYAEPEMAPLRATFDPLFRRCLSHTIKGWLATPDAAKPGAPPRER